MAPVGGSYSLKGVPGASPRAGSGAQSLLRKARRCPPRVAWLKRGVVRGFEGQWSSRDRGCAVLAMGAGGTRDRVQAELCGSSATSAALGCARATHSRCVATRPTKPECPMRPSQRAPLQPHALKELAALCLVQAPVNNQMLWMINQLACKRRTSGTNALHAAILPCSNFAEPPPASLAGAPPPCIPALRSLCSRNCPLPPSLGADSTARNTPHTPHTQPPQAVPPIAE